MHLGKLLGRLSGALAVTMLAGGTALAAPSAMTPIEHVVVIFQENISFDHYFATYPNAANSDGTPFTAVKGTPSVNGLTPGLMGKFNPNWNGTFGTPFRLSFMQAATCDENHDYMPEQQAFDSGLMDMFPEFVNLDCMNSSLNGAVLDANHPNDIVMGYYDGNTVTALWNYAQNFAMNDNSYGTQFGPSTVGAVNLISGYTAMATQVTGSGDVSSGAITADPQPAGDICTTRDSASLAGKNIGDVLNDAGLTWGWFEGGFDLTITNPNGSHGTNGCGRTTSSQTSAFSPKTDYIPHHQPFQYYTSTANLNHTRPSTGIEIGAADPTGANHQYDSHDFFDALQKGVFPSVVFLKAPGYQDGHPGYSTPVDEQTWIVDVINTLEESKFWDNTAVFISWDDSDGWYDHQMSPTIFHSQTDGGGTSGADALTGTNMCGGSGNALQAQGRCGYGPRLPFMVVSPWAKTNFVDHTLTDQSSIIAFIEKNWGLPFVMPETDSDPGSADQYAGSVENMFDFTQKKGAVKKHILYLNPANGAVVKKKPKLPGNMF